MATQRGSLRFALFVLFAINFMNFYDRQVVGAIGERVKQEWNLTDARLALLTTAFVLLYAAVGIPLGRWADTGRRNVILSAGVLVWSVFTGFSGLAWSYASLFLFRLGVGVGEASCAPASNSLLGDLFPPEQRARAISLFMLGLPLGSGATYLLSGLVMQWTGGWRGALFVAAVPGIILGLLALRLPEPERGAADRGVRDSALRGWEAIGRILSVATMRWIIASGALFNLVMYALAAFLTSFLARYHGLDLTRANIVSGLTFGFAGTIGLLGGGWLADRASRRQVEGRMRVGAAAVLASVPLFWLALTIQRGDVLMFAAPLFGGCAIFYVYYPSVYATIQDVIEPRLRGTAMAVYFFVFYLFTAFGLYAFGWLSDRLAGTARASGAVGTEASALGLFGAMHAIPLLALLVAGALWAGSRHVAGDHARLRSA